MDISYLLRQPFGTGSRIDPSRVAVSFGADQKLSYSELAQKSYSLARELIGLGIAPGDRIALMMFNSLEYWMSYFAVTRIGAIVVRVNFRLSADELEFVLNDSGAVLAIADQELLDRIADRRTDIGVRIYVSTSPVTLDSDHYLGTLMGSSSGNGLAEAIVDDLTISNPGSDDLAMIMYTSGTTGRPKGAMWTHANTMWFTAMQAMEWGFTQDTVIFVAGPLYHVGALEDYSLPTLLAGGEVVFLPSGAFDISMALSIASQRRVTDLTLFPSMIYQMLQLDDLDTFDLSTVRRIFTGGDPLLGWAVEQIQVRFPGVDVVQVYGLTEGTPVVACGGTGMAFLDPGSVGRPLPLCEISIRDDEGLELADGDRGEIWTRSPANSLGYWQLPAATADTFVDGWCKTGDYGVVDGGALSVTGRKKDMIRSGGENIYAREVEDVLMRHPAVTDAAVIAVPDAKFTEAVCAVLVTGSGMEVSSIEIVEYCSAHLASSKKPKYVEFVVALPRTASQKIQKFKLREQFAHLGEQLPNSELDTENPIK